jgi:hypothetical protein
MSKLTKRKGDELVKDDELFKDSKVDRRFQKAPKYSSYIVTGTTSNIGKFRFRSETDLTKTYEVHILQDGSMACNCGKQFGEESRGHCKHVSSVLKEMMTKYRDSMVTCGKQRQVNDLFESLKI